MLGSLSDKVVGNKEGNRGNKETKHAKFSAKANISYPLIHIGFSACLFFCYLRFEIRPFTLLPAKVEFTCLEKHNEVHRKLIMK